MINLRLIVRPHRLEVVGVAAFVALTFVVGGYLVYQLLAFDIPVVCFRDGGGMCEGRQADVEAYRILAQNAGESANMLIALLPAMLGLLMGIALVGKELDLGTTTFAWSVGPSRRRWLALRVAPFAVAIVVAGLAAGGLGDWLEALREPGTDPQAAWGHLGLRGPVVGAMGLAFFGIALLVGAVIGRMLPALLMAIVVVIGAGAGVTLLSDNQLENETVLVYGMDGGVPGRVVDYMIQVPTGEILSYGDAYERYGEELDYAGEFEGGTSKFRTVLRVNPAEIYPWAVARFSILYGGLGLLAIVLTFAVVERRRP